MSLLWEWPYSKGVYRVNPVRWLSMRNLCGECIGERCLGKSIQTEEGRVK